LRVEILSGAALAKDKVVCQLGEVQLIEQKDQHMKNIVVITAIFALSFATGFTCSKNAPEQAAQPTAETTTTAAPADQATMATSGDATAAPVSADASAAQPAAPAETK